MSPAHRPGESLRPGAGQHGVAYLSDPHTWGSEGGWVCPTPGVCSGLCLSLPAHYLGAMGLPWALLAALWALGAAGAAALRIGAFNIQSFGDSKVLDSDCASVIAQVRRGPGLGPLPLGSAGEPAVRDPAPTVPSPDLGWL